MDSKSQKVLIIGSDNLKYTELPGGSPDGHELVLQPEQAKVELLKMVVPPVFRQRSSYKNIRHHKGKRRR